MWNSFTPWYLPVILVQACSSGWCPPRTLNSRSHRGCNWHPNPGENFKIKVLKDFVLQFLIFNFSTYPLFRHMMVVRILSSANFVYTANPYISNVLPSTGPLLPLCLCETLLKSTHHGPKPAIPRSLATGITNPTLNLRCIADIALWIGFRNM